VEKIISIFRWTIGIAVFVFSFNILVFCLLLLPRKTTFRIARFLFSIVIRLMGIKLVVNGRENIDPDHPYLIMGNHQSLFDLLVIPIAIPVCFVGIEAAYHFSIPVWGYLIRKWGNIPIQRNNLEKAILSLEMAEKAFLKGMNICMLPEGHRSLTGKIAPFKKGPFHLAKAVKGDILPFGINGLFNHHKKGSLIINPTCVVVNIGKPVPYKSFQDLSVDQIRQKTFDIINELSQKREGTKK